MDPAAFVPYQTQPQGAFGGGTKGPRGRMAQASTASINNGQIPQGSKLATYMNRGNFGAPDASQVAADLGSLGLDSSTLKKLSLTGIREFMPAAAAAAAAAAASAAPPQPTSSSSSANAAPISTTTSSSFRSSVGSSPGPGQNNSGSSSPFAMSAQRQSLQPPMGSFGGGSSARASPTPSSSSVSSMMNTTAQQSAAAVAADMDPSNIAAFSDGGTTYFYSGDEMPMGGEGMNNGAAAAASQVLLPNYSVYTGTPSYVANLKLRTHVPNFMAENELKMELLRRQHISLAQIDPEAYSHLPTSVDNFTHLCPLEPPPPTPLHKSHTFGYVTSVYKGTNTKNGQYVTLRRIHGYRLVNTKCMVLVDQWKKLQHANLVALRQVFTTKTFNDHSMVFVYDFYPGAETLMARHFNSPSQVGTAFMDPFSGTDGGARPYSQHKNQLLRQQAMLTQNGLLPESLIWTYVIQMTSALRHIHSAGLACRTLDPTKILIINKTRLLLNCCGIFDVLTYDPTSSNPMAAMAHYQQEDLIALGKIVLALACNSFLAIQRENLQTSMEIVTSTYSSDMRNLIMYLLTNPTRVKSVNDMMPMIGARFYAQLDAALLYNDTIEAELSKEIESARLFRVLTKLSTVVDRAELNGDFGWAEYGDRYMLKLFRDYVFHQIMEDTRPWLDMAHVVSCLNRLDAGVSDKVCLMSRDEQNVLVVSYGELRQCLEQSFSECVHAARSTNAAPNALQTSASTASMSAYNA